MNKIMKLTAVLMLALVVAMSFTVYAEETESIELIERQESVYDIFDYLADIDLDMDEETFYNTAVHNLEVIQHFTTFVNPDSLKKLNAACVHVHQGKENAKEEYMNALNSLELYGPVSENAIFLWSADNMPVVDGETYTAEELEANPQDGADFIPLLEKVMLDDPASAKGNLIIISGGGFTARNNDIEGYPTAEVFKELGYNCFVLQRRIEPYSHDDTFMDMQRAIRVVRYYAEKEGWGGQDMIAACGFSGGGATIMGSVVHLYGDLTPAALGATAYIPDDIDLISSDLDAALVIYGAMMDDGLQDNPNLPAFFLLAGTEDRFNADEGTQALYEQIKDVVPSELHMIEGAPHGFGVGTVARTGDDIEECKIWPEWADAFMQANLGHSQK